MEKTVSSRRIYTGRTLNLRVDTVRLTNGSTAEREVVEHAAVVHIVPVDGEGRLLLIRQYRVPAEKELLELPAGGIRPDESPVDAAQRELREETGYRAGRLDPVASFYSTPGYCDEFNHVFMATDLVHDPLDPDADEDISMFPVSAEEARRLVEANEIGDAKSAAGILLYLMFHKDKWPRAHPSTSDHVVDVAGSDQISIGGRKCPDCSPTGRCGAGLRA